MNDKYNFSLPKERFHLEVCTNDQRWSLKTQYPEYSRGAIHYLTKDELNTHSHTHKFIFAYECCVVQKKRKWN